MRKIKLALLAAKIELQWWLIKKERKKAKKLLDSGLAHSSPKIVALNQRFSKHCATVLKTQKEYEKLSGVFRIASKAVD